jgi:hypothetical protein
VIANTMNFFWGGEAMSWMRFLTLKSFCHFNPDWDVQLWMGRQFEVSDYWDTKESQDFMGYIGADYMIRVAELPVTVMQFDSPWPQLDELTPVHESDLFRWWLLSKESGWYADMDILWTAPMVSSESSVATCQAGGNFAIGLLGSDGESRFYHDVLQKALLRVSNADYQSGGTKSVNEVLTGQQNTIHVPNVPRLIKGKYGCKLDELPESTVYPWHYPKIDRVFLENFEVPDTTVGIHWYAGTTLAQKFNTYAERDVLGVTPETTFSKYARRVL